MDAIGLDLGTTNTVIAANSSVIELQPGTPDEEPSTLLPSAVSFPPSGMALVGQSAIQRRIMDPLNTITSSKRVIGESWSSYNAVRFRENYQFEMVKSADGGVSFQTRTGRFTPGQIASLIVGTVWRRTTVPMKDLIVVVTVPTAFQLQNCEATRAAVLKSGVRSVRVLHEPVATALAYLRRSNLDYAAIYDLGGGTFDLSVIACDKYPLRILASGGDLYLGGDTIDRAIAVWVAERTLREHRWDLLSDREVFARLVAECEQAKIRLSDVEQTEVDITRADLAAPGQVPNVVLDRATLWELALPTIRPTFQLCDEILDCAKLKVTDIDAVFLAGGTTALPGFKEYIGQYFGKRPRSDINPMHAVAIGASMGAVRAELADFVAPMCQ